MEISIRLFADPVKTLAFGSIVAGYTAIDTGLLHPAHMVFVQNLTDVSLMFSIDGINDHFPLPANGYLVMDVTSNKSVSNALFIATGTTFYVKCIGIPTTGSVYVSSFYSH